MSEDKWLGKIEKVEMGIGGYNDIMFGISFTLTGSGYGVGDFWGFNSTEWSSRCNWTEEERIKGLGEMCMRVKKLLDDAKVNNISQLKGKPVEVEASIGKPLKGWRILTEVL